MAGTPGPLTPTELGTGGTGEGLQDMEGGKRQEWVSEPWALTAWDSQDGPVCPTGASGTTPWPVVLGWQQEPHPLGYPSTYEPCPSQWGIC